MNSLILSFFACLTISFPFFIGIIYLMNAKSDSAVTPVLPVSPQVSTQSESDCGINFDPEITVSIRTAICKGADQIGIYPLYVKKTQPTKTLSGRPSIGNAFAHEPLEPGIGITTLFLSEQSTDEERIHLALHEMCHYRRYRKYGDYVPRSQVWLDAWNSSERNPNIYAGMAIEEFLAENCADFAHYGRKAFQGRPLTLKALQEDL